MKLNLPVSGIYKITNTKTGKIYIGESVNIQVRIATHFAQLHSDQHVNLEMQDDHDKFGAGFFEYEILEELNAQKPALRARETEYIAEYLASGARLYNGENKGFLHVKNRRRERKNEQWRNKPAKRKLFENFEGDVPGHSEVFGTGINVESGANDDLAGDQQKPSSFVFDTGNGTAGADKESAPEGPASEGVDANRQPGESDRSVEEKLSASDERENTRIGILENLIDEWPPTNDDLIYLLDEYLDSDYKSEIEHAIKETTLNLYFEEEAERDECARLMALYLAPDRAGQSRHILNVLRRFDEFAKLP